MKRHTRHLCIALGAIALLPLDLSAAMALDARIRNQLEKLAPDERLEQRCDIKAMDEISGAGEGFRPDKVIAYAFGDPTLDGTTLKTKGAVFRSRGEWYRLSYKCETTADGLHVSAFRYTIGKQVPREEWAAHYLYD